MLDKINKRLASWKGGLLNRARRVCLAKSVISSILIYHMQVMLFPQTVCQEIDKLTHHFIWNGKMGARSLNLVNWNTLISPRRFGGLAVRDACSTNLSLLGKLIWELMQNSAKCWARLVHHKYMQNGSVV